MAKDKSRKKNKPKKPAVKPAAIIVTGINEEKVKPPVPATNTAVNLCDECAYEFGACEGIPKFASEADPTLKGTEADRVVECKGYVNVQSLPTADKVNQGKVADAEEPAQENTAPINAILPAGRASAIIERFKREEDLGECPSCNQALKRTALNRDRDAVRCVNHTCRQYRAIVKTIPAK